MVRAALHDATDVEVVSVEEVGDRDAEQVLCSEFLVEDSREEVAACVGLRRGGNGESGRGILARMVSHSSTRPLSHSRVWGAAATPAARLPCQILPDQFPRFAPGEADAVG